MTSKRTIILPPGSQAETPLGETGRSIEREKENQEYIPVIIKRTDEVLKHPDDTLYRAIKEGFEQFQRRSQSLLLSSIAAGLILGFVALLVAFSTHLYPDDANWAVKRLISAAFYPFGFIVCIISGAKLYTEQTATAIYPVLEGNVSIFKLFQLWGVVLLGNLVGTLVVSLLILSAESAVHIGTGYIVVAEHMLKMGTIPMLMSSILAGWLMAQGSWLVLSTSTSTAQIACIYIVTFIIGVGGLTHSIAGSAELFIAYLIADNILLVNVLKVIAIAVVGNSIGGSFFVGILNYAHIRKTQELLNTRKN
ncbi:MAG: formate/nitrite transporter family protein [Oligoflexales bacterium]|nr:formate/nitrite transporter family protein [Oligoflexales bacterium]